MLLPADIERRPKLDVSERAALLASAGLRVMDPAWSGAVVEPFQAWRVIIVIDAQPVLKVADVGGEYQWQQALTFWRAEGVAAGLFSPDGRFLISLANEGEELPWCLVRLGDEVGAMERLMRRSPSCDEFVAMSVDGRVVSGIGVEEDGLWIYAMPYVQPVERPDPVKDTFREMRRNGFSAFDALVNFKGQGLATGKPWLKVASVMRQVYGITTDQHRVIGRWWRDDATTEELADAFLGDQ
jgi:hypothetical protein